MKDDMKDDIITNYLRGALGITKATLGIMKAPDDVVARRRGICAMCEYQTIASNKNLGGRIARCKLCKCIVKAKTLLKNENCPDDPPRWTAIS